MTKYILRRILGWALMIVLATNLTYFLASAFLDPRANYLQRRPPVPEFAVDANLTRFNLNDKEPILHRWWDWITAIVLHWNWGASPEGASVNDQVATRIWVSAEFVLGATVLTALIGIALGVFTASRQYKASDRILQQVSVVTLNIPTPVMALAAVVAGIALNNQLGRTVLFVAGSGSVGTRGFLPGLLDGVQHLILPTVTLVVTGYSGYHFLQRALLLDNIGADYVRTARAKGLTKATAIRRHALPTSIIPVATSIAFSIPGIFTGAVIAETIFGWEGMGRYFVTTISKNDIHGAVAVAAFGSVVTAIGAVLSDVVVGILDPRVRVS
ncbi:peptide/nickel transport system permease protein [Kribbella aluminosa]|uniref:Peptide/nickel transport system permease protein n=1 Tax=Kribbella aluminosa TaxID=416017 RepID=A0ABS4UWQ0_9ACTN|nr:ABC transporter permease [Kribbella aluminosa]MBP2356075.1 peptide/nickel transport system permease protein [Kribbella aluminosa]